MSNQVTIDALGAARELLRNIAAGLYLDVSHDKQRKAIAPVLGRLSAAIKRSATTPPPGFGEGAPMVEIVMGKPGTTDQDVFIVVLKNHHEMDGHPALGVSRAQLTRVLSELLTQEVNGAAIYSKRCCERDHDRDGNCDRHPEVLP